MAKKSEPSAKFKEFSGLNNKVNPRSLGAGELCRADNIDIDDRNHIRRRRGHDSEHIAGVGISACWSSNDETRMFLIDGGILEEYLGDGSTRELATGFTVDEAYFADAGDRFFLSCGPDLGFIDADGYHNLVIHSPPAPVVLPVPGGLSAGRRMVATVLEAPDGRQGPASRIMMVDLDAGSGMQISVQEETGFLTRIYVSKANGEHLHYAGTLVSGSTLIANDWQVEGEVLDEVQIHASTAPVQDGPIAYLDGRLWLSVIDRPAGLTYLFKSEPFWPHLFTPWRDAETVHGQVRMLAATKEAMLVGTDRSIFAIGGEGGLTTLADYGVVPGQNHHYDRNSNAVYFWSSEGICRGLPFENMTEDRVSAPPGDRCYVGMVKEGGYSRLVVGTHVADGDNAVASNPSDHYQYRHGQG
jgi:hypothetical protein